MNKLFGHYFTPKSNRGNITNEQSESVNYDRGSSYKVTLNSEANQGML
jgi:hypothetical protein